MITHIDSDKLQKVYTIRWINGDLTCETKTYLRKLDNVDDETRNLDVFKCNYQTNNNSDDIYDRIDVEGDDNEEYTTM